MPGTYISKSVFMFTCYYKVLWWNMNPHIYLWTGSTSTKPPYCPVQNLHVWISKWQRVSRKNTHTEGQQRRNKNKEVRTENVCPLSPKWNLKPAIHDLSWVLQNPSSNAHLRFRTCCDSKLAYRIIWSATAHNHRKTSTSLSYVKVDVI